MPWVPSSSARQRASRQGPQLPAGFTSINDILNETVQAGSLANVVGLVKDCRLPIPTKGTDYKSVLVLSDLSTQDSNDGIQFNIFGPEAEMPVVNAGDVVMVLQAKIQRFRSNPLSLISSYRTVVHVFAASRILKPPRSAKAALLPARAKNVYREPNDRECEYVSYLYHSIDKYDVPDEAQFHSMANQSLNLKQKFSLLQDVCEGKFYDLIVQIVRDPFDFGDKITLYVSDYTENELFFNYTWEGVRDLSFGETGGYGSTPLQDSMQKAWIGPYGKKAMQITCYEPNAGYIRHEAKAGSWVSLQNVQVKFGRNGANLEGFMREDRSTNYPKVCVHVLDIVDRDTVDPRLKDAIRRWRDYTKEKKADLKRLKTTELKRKFDGEPEKKMSKSKLRRKQRREAVEKKIDEQALKEEQSLGLNQLVTSESVEKPTCTVESILEPNVYETTINGEQSKLLLPFICGKYRANVRVIDFRPNCLEDFACSRKHTAFDALSDYSGDESSDNSGRDDGDDLATGQLIWEWRFMFQLEDASAKDKARNRIWVVVDNPEAQYLTGLDASDLRQDPENLACLRERLFTLWGDLEEHKARKLAEQAALRQLRPGEMPPPMESSDAEDNGGAHGAGGAGTVSNKPFTCCIKQYGIQVREDNPSFATAGKGKRWERVFALFGTKISC